MLQRYVKIDTTNPPGNEIAAARFLSHVLEREGIASRIIESAPGRANLYARIEGSSEGKSLILLHHMDVVPASVEEWSVPPLSATITDGALWGRGAIDDKGPGLVSFLSMMMLRRLGITLPTDVILLAVADEEAGGGHGARFLMDQHFDLFADVGYALNEGGAIMQHGPDASVYHVEVGQKAPLWLRITATGKSGHGSSPRPDSATHVLVRALSRLEAHRFPIVIVPEVQAMFTQQGLTMPSPQRERFADLEKSLKNAAFRAEFMGNGRQAGLVTNTLAVTMLQGSDKENVLSAKASAVLDIRLLPGQDPAVVTAELVRVMNEPALEVETLLSWQSQSASQSTPLFAAIQTLAQRDGATVSASVIGGFTDCNALRTRGIACYGFLPMRIAMEDIGRIHGKDERASIDALANAVVALASLLQIQ